MTGKKAARQASKAVPAAIPLAALPLPDVSAGDQSMLGAVGETLELIAVFITIMLSLAIMVVFGRYWER